MAGVTCLRCGRNTEGSHRAKVIRIGDGYVGTVCGECVGPVSSHAPEIRDAIRQIVGGQSW